jgi:hypothetical protein
MKRLAPLFWTLFGILVVVGFAVLIIRNDVFPIQAAKQPPPDESMCTVGDAECWNACDAGVPKCSVLAHRARNEILANKLPCDGVSEVANAAHGSADGTAYTVWCDQRKYVYSLDSLLEMVDEQQTPEQLKAAGAKYEEGIREIRAEAQRRRERGPAAAVTCVGIKGDCDTVAREMRRLINANGWACVTVDSVMKSVFSHSWAVKCNRLSASFTVDKHGGLWRVQATD